MRTIMLVGVWAYLMVAVAAEVETFYSFSNPSVIAAVVGVFAVSQAIAIAVFFMHLKDEPGSLRLFSLIPILFLSGLLIAMLATLG